MAGRERARACGTATATAAAGFGTIGFFSSLVPALLKSALGQPNHALGGLVIFSLYAATAVGQLAGRRRAIPPAWCSPRLAWRWWPSGSPMPRSWW